MKLKGYSTICFIVPLEFHRDIVRPIMHSYACSYLPVLLVGLLGFLKGILFCLCINRREVYFLLDNPFGSLRGILGGYYRSYDCFAIDFRNTLVVYKDLYSPIIAHLTTCSISLRVIEVLRPSLASRNFFRLLLAVY